MTGTQECLVHGTCVALAGRAALLRGTPGAGKSDLALRFVSGFGEEGAGLVSDDQVRLQKAGGTLRAAAPEALAGRLEVRGIDIIEIAFVGSADLVLIVDLVAREEVPRLPFDPLPSETLLGVSLPVLALDPFAASAPLKLKIALGGTP